MKSVFFLIALNLLGLAAIVEAAGIPAQITYQGTLRDKTGTPITDPKMPMRFRIIDKNNGNIVWSIATPIQVSVTNGLFSVPLSPSGVDWQNITPYLEVEVNGQTLSPSEPINANVYALMSQSIVDGAVTRAKINTASFETPGSGLVPAGAIMMFTTDCPVGWNVFAGLQGRFPVGADPTNSTDFSLGQSSGAASHSHTVDAHTHAVPNHVHSIDDGSLSVGIGIRNVSFDNDLSMQLGSVVGTYSSSNANQWYGYSNGMSHPAPTGTNSENVAITGPKITGGTLLSGNTTTGSASPGTDSKSNLPPYKTLVFCQKQ